MLLCISFYNLYPLTWLIYKALWTIIDCSGTSDCYPITSNPTQWLDTRTRNYCPVDVTSNPIQWLDTSNHNYLPAVYTSSWTYDRTLVLVTVCPVKSLIIRHNDWTLVLVTVVTVVILDTKASIRSHLDGSYPGSIAIWGGAPISKELSNNP